MRWIILDGLYPTNVAFNLAPIIVILFEIAIIGIEVGIANWILKGKVPIRNLSIAVIIANLATFALGYGINFALQSESLIIYISSDSSPFWTVLVTVLIALGIFFALYPKVNPKEEEHGHD